MYKLKVHKNSLLGAVTGLAGLLFAAMPVTNAIADGEGLEVVGEDGVEDAEHRAFFVTMDTDGEEKTIAVAGPFEVAARCDFVAGNNTDVAIVFWTSTTPGAFNANIGPDATANQERTGFVVVQLSGNKGMTDFRNSGRMNLFGQDADGTLYQVVIEGDTLMIGLNVFGHRCIFAGQISLVELAD